MVNEGGQAIVGQVQKSWCPPQHCLKHYKIIYHQWVMLRLILIFIFIPSFVLAADLEKFVLDDDPSVPVVIQLKGEIVDGDAEAFEKVIEGYSKVTLILENPGGLVHEALRIGATLHQNNFVTMVVDLPNIVSEAK